MNSKSVFCLLLLVGIYLGCSDIQKYDGLAKEGIDEGLPGIIIGIQKNNETWIDAAGLANIEQDIPMTKSDRFHIASITKLFTSVAVLKLIDDNKLSLNSRTDSLLADSLVTKIPYINEIKIHHLLDHSSGIYSFNNDLRYVNTYLGKEADKNIKWSSEQLIRLAYGDTSKAQGRPGSAHYYSDTNTILLGLIIEKISGDPFRQHIKKTILDPLELNDTGFYAQHTDTNNVERSTTVQGYLKESEIIDNFLELSPSFQQVSDSLLNTTAAVERIDASAGIVSTAADLLKFGRAVYKENFLSHDSLNWLLSIGNNIEKENMDAVRQGIVTVRKKPYGILYTSLGDGGGGINSMLAYLPKQELLVVAYTNIFGRFDEHDFFIDNLIPSIIARTEGTQSTFKR